MNTIRCSPVLGGQWKRTILFGFVCILLLQVSAARKDDDSSDDGETLKNYKPVAMDESLSIVKSANNGGSKRQHPDVDGSRASDDGILDSLADVEDVSRKNLDISSTLFKLPTQETAALTRLITDVNQTPTFFGKDLAKPVSTDGQEVLAKYKLMVPIFVPSIKQKLQPSTRMPIKFVEETKTEMMPVTNVVPRVKEVLKAEEVPQDTVTELISTGSRSGRRQLTRDPSDPHWEKREDYPYANHNPSSPRWDRKQRRPYESYSFFPSDDEWPPEEKKTYPYSWGYGRPPPYPWRERYWGR